MITLNIPCDGSVTKITLGRRGENEVVKVIFDATSLAEKYGSGNATLLAKRPTDTDAYPCATTQTGNSIEWVVSNADTQYKGWGECELFWYIDDALAKSLVFQTYTDRDIGASSETPPQPQEGWVEQLIETMNGKLDTAEGYVEDAEAWAKGTRNGVAVESTDEAYHKNSKYYSEQASSSATSAASSAQQASTILANTILIGNDGNFYIND